jgi:chloramphenicol 3-O-phosphotransferase
MIIILNGTSSSGKSTIAQALQHQLGIQRVRSCLLLFTNLKQKARPDPRGTFLFGWSATPLV